MSQEILDEKVIRKCGSYQQVQRHLRGFHRKRGSLCKGWQGKETIEIKDKIVPIYTFIVKPSED